MNHNYSTISNQTDLLRTLISTHRKFQEELDIITSANNDPDIIDDLIELRRSNINITNRYCAMLVRSQCDLLPPAYVSSQKSFSLAENEVMWKIHYEMSVIIQIYGEIISNRVLSDFNRKIIARNLDLIIRQKDELLHPIRQSVA